VGAIAGLAVLFLVWWIIGVRQYVRIRVAPEGSRVVYVTAKQWMWKIQHPQGPREINALHLPLGQAVRLTMTSEDVIHSFYVPAFRVKQDVLPGRYTHMWFRPTKLGTFHLFCAEYCGTKHSGMIGDVVVMEPQDYERWLAAAVPNETQAEAGKKLFESLRCGTCHATDPSGVPPGVQAARGPSLEGLFGRDVEIEGGARLVADEAYVRESILKPMARITKGYQPLMPTYEGQVGEEQILEIIAYLKTLQPSGGGR